MFFVTNSCQRNLQLQLHLNMNQTSIINSYIQSTICPFVSFQIAILILHILHEIVKLTLCSVLCYCHLVFHQHVYKMVDVTLMHQLSNVLFCEQHLSGITVFLNLQSSYLHRVLVVSKTLFYCSN